MVKGRQNEFKAFSGSRIDKRISSIENPADIGKNGHRRRSQKAVDCGLSELAEKNII